MTEFKSLKTRRQQNKEEIIDDILAIARAMMRKDGVGALSFNAIARELGIKPPSLYTYFDSKNAIYDALFRRGYETFGQVMNERPHRDASFALNFKTVLETYMQFALDNPELFQLMFERPVPDFVPSDESMAVSYAMLNKSREEIGHIIASGEIQPDMTGEEAGDIAIVIMHGLTALHMANHPHLPAGEGRFGKLIDKIIDLVVQGWQPKGWQPKDPQPKDD